MTASQVDPKISFLYYLAKIVVSNDLLVMQIILFPFSSLWCKAEEHPLKLVRLYNGKSGINAQQGFLYHWETDEL